MLALSGHGLGTKAGKGAVDRVVDTEVNVREFWGCCGRAGMMGKPENRKKPEGSSPREHRPSLSRARGEEQRLLSPWLPMSAHSWVPLGG